MCFAVFSFCFPNPNNKKKPAHPGDESPERLASKFISPSEERLAFSGLASRHIGSLLNGGEITYHLTWTKKFKFILGTSVEKCDYSIL